MAVPALIFIENDFIRHAVSQALDTVKGVSWGSKTQVKSFDDAVGFSNLLSTKFMVTITDYHLDFVRLVKSEFHDHKVIVLTDVDERAKVRTMWELGVDGYISNASWLDLTDALSNVNHHRSRFISQSLSGFVNDDNPLISWVMDLDVRDKLILNKVMSGWSAERISNSSKVNLSAQGVYSRVKNICSSLNERLDVGPSDCNGSGVKSLRDHQHKELVLEAMDIVIDDWS